LVDFFVNGGTPAKSGYVGWQKQFCATANQAEAEMWKGKWGGVAVMEVPFQKWLFAAWVFEVG